MSSLGSLLPPTLICIFCFAASLYSLRAVTRDRFVRFIGRQHFRQTFAEGSKQYRFYVGSVKGLIALSGFASVLMVALDCIMLI